MHDRVVVRGDPRTVGQALKGSIPGEFWKYRCGDRVAHLKSPGAALGCVKNDRLDHRAIGGITACLPACLPACLLA